MNDSSINDMSDNAVDGELPSESDNLEIERNDFTVYHSDVDLSNWINRIESKSVPIKIPPFQRAYKWEKSKASKLIESFLLGLPVPPIMVHQEKVTNRSVIIDGQQRLFSVYFFYKGLFPKHDISLTNLSSGSIFYESENFENFELENVKEQWKGKTYETLAEDDKLWLDSRILGAIIFRQIIPDDEKGIFYIFERLNTGGLLLTPMEIRKAIYYGNFFELLIELNNLQTWKKLTNKFVPDQDLRDIEWILRFFSLHDWKTYKEPMKEYLNKYIRKNRQLTDTECNQKRESFENTCNLIHNSLGDKPFHILSDRLNLALLDSFMVIVSKHIDKLNKQRVIQLYEEMRKSDKYIDSVRSRVNIVEKVLKTRFDTLEGLLYKLLESEK